MPADGKSGVVLLDSKRSVCALSGGVQGSTQQTDGVNKFFHYNVNYGPKVGLYYINVNYTIKALLKLARNEEFPGMGEVRIEPPYFVTLYKMIIYGTS